MGAVGPWTGEGVSAGGAGDSGFVAVTAAGCLLFAGGLAVGSSGSGAGNSTRAKGMVASAASLTDWGGGNWISVCGVESGGGGAGGFAAAVATGGAGVAGVLLAAFLPLITHDDSARIAAIRGMVKRRVILHHRKPHRERGAFARFTREIDCTIVQLHNPECHRQADAGTLFLGSEVKPEDLLAQFGRNPRT